MSYCTSAMSAMKNMVIAPITITNDWAAWESSKSGDMRATMKIPAVTMVAAWMSAEMGVGPSIESGSHTCSGTCADLPMAPMNRQMQISVSAPTAEVELMGMSACAICGAAANASRYASEWVK